MSIAAMGMQILTIPLLGPEKKTDNLMNKFTCQIVLFLTTCLLALSFPLYAMFWIHPHFTNIVTFEKEVNAKQIANHISKMLILDSTEKTITQKNITDSFIATLEEAQLDFDLTKVKVFSSRGEVLHSTDNQDIGDINTNPYFTDLISKGKIFSKIVHKNEKTMEGEVVKKDVVETYVPLLRDQHFIGAFEIYYDITYSDHIIGKFVAQSHIIILMISVLLLLSIMSISLSAIFYLRKLRKAKVKLQKLKDQMPPLYTFSSDKTDK